MHDLDTLRELTPAVRPPTFDSLRQTARRRAGRTRVLAGVAGLTAVLVVGGALAGVNEVDRTAPEPGGTTGSPGPTHSDRETDREREPSPSPEPTHASETSMTAREVALSEESSLQLTGVSMFDPDFRISVWKAECTWCPKNFAGLRPTFASMAVTTDGFDSTTYRRPGYDTDLPTYVESPGPGLLLIVDDSNGYEWLVRDDGSVTRLKRVVEERPPADPRGWFVCLASADEAARYRGDYFLTWCALDPATNTAYEWGARWRATSTETASAVSPGAGVEPWGREFGFSTRLVAWWDVDGVRQRRQVADEDQRNFVLNAPGGRPLYWSLDNEDKVLTLHRLVGSDQWESFTHEVPFFPRSADVLATPGGGLVVRQVTDSGTRMWRSDGIDSGDWRIVYNSQRFPYEGDEGDGEERPFTVFGDTLWSADLVSLDDGLTWNGPGDWR